MMYYYIDLEPARSSTSQASHGGDPLKFSFLPVQVEFFDHFQSATTNLLEAAHALQQLLDNPQNVSAQVSRIIELEHCGDLIVHEVTNLLPRTLLTPFDGTDIQRLIDAVDDAVDTIHIAAVRLDIYQIAEVKEPARRLAALIVEGATELDRAMRLLHDKKLYGKVKASIVQINTIENQGDRVFEECLRDLVQNRADVYDFICWKEICELLEQCIDR
jgi:uncharacterized protein Yka (UPF0111/DUF47 family)